MRTRPYLKEHLVNRLIFSRGGFSSRGMIGRCVWSAVAALAFAGRVLIAQDLPGSLRVRVVDSDWEAPVAEAVVLLVESGAKAATDGEGQALFDKVDPGAYTLSISAAGFDRRVTGPVTILAGQAEVFECRVYAAYTDMDEFVVRDIDFGGGGSDLRQLEIRSQSSSLMDAVGSDMMSRAGVSTAAAAMRLVTGASIQDGKYAVIRGLGDRYTATLLNGVRLPTADKDKRAVHMDQFPAAMIESIQVTKTFMPDQQGDASGGINIVTRGMPAERVLSASVSMEWDSEATGNDRFMTHRDGANRFMGMREQRLDFWDDETIPRGLASRNSGVLSHDDPSPNYGFKFAAGDLYQSRLGYSVGGLVNGSYSQKYKLMQGQRFGLDTDPVGKASKTKIDPLKTKEVSTSVDEQLWSAGMTMGIRNSAHELKFTTVYTHQSKDVVDIRRGVERATHTGPTDTLITRKPRVVGTYEKWTTNNPINTVVQYTETQNGSFQLAGKSLFEELNDTELNWTVAYNVAESIEPDRQSFAGMYSYERDELKNKETGEIVKATTNSLWRAVNPTDYQRRWQDTREAGWQPQMDIKTPFEVFGQSGYGKIGGFADRTDRSYRNRVYNLLSAEIPAASEFDFSGIDRFLSKTNNSALYSEGSIEYDGSQEIDALYGMMRLPLPEWIDLIGGARLERTCMETDIWSYGGEKGWLNGVLLNQDTNGTKSVALRKIKTSAAATTIEQWDTLPAVSANLKPVKDLSFRLGYSQTIARPTFKELTPVPYVDIDPNKVFVGNQDIELSSLDNYDARVEWRPGGSMDILAVGVFYKTIADPIQYSSYFDVQPGSDRMYTVPENYGDAWVKGIEFEARKSLDFIWRDLKDFSVGGNATMQDSYVEYDRHLVKELRKVGVRDEGRQMDGQPDFLANLNLMFDNEATGLSCGLFYNYKGETYVSGETASAGQYIPHTLEMPVHTLDFTFGYKFYGNWRLGFEVKNLLTPDIETVYRTAGGKELPGYSYKSPRLYTLSLGCKW